MWAHSSEIALLTARNNHLSEIEEQLVTERQQHRALHDKFEELRHSIGTSVQTQVTAKLKPYEARIHELTERLSCIMRL